MELRNEERPYEDVIPFDDMDSFISFVSRLRIVQPFLDYDREMNQFVATRTFDRFDYLPAVSD